MALNLDSLIVDSTGRASFSGLSSGIDFADVVNKIIAAKRIPAVTLENRITDNDAKIVAYKEMRTLLQAFQTSLGNLRGKVRVGGTGNVFTNKQVFASTSRTDGVLPTAAGSLVGVSASNAAASGTHTIELRRVAAAHKVSSSAFTSQTTALSFSGSFTITKGTTDTTITVAATDTLLDIRDRINNVNTGSNATGVSASIVAVSSTENYLVLTQDTAGTNIVVTDTGTVLSSLGLSSTNGLGNLRNGLSSGSKIEVADGFLKFLADGTQTDSAFLVTYDSGTRVLTLTRGDGQTDTATLAAGAIGAGDTETATFSTFGFDIVLDENFDKATGITVAADTSSINLGTGVIDDASIKIFDSTGDVSAITSTTLTFGNLASPASISVTVGGFTGSFDGTSTGVKTVTLADSSGNELLVQFNVTNVFDGNETAGSITLNELQNMVNANTTQYTSVLQKAQTARLTADGLKDATSFESGVVSSKTAALTNFAPNATFPGSFDIVGTGTKTISYTSSDTLATLSDKINAETATTGVTARIVADVGGFRLELNATSAFSLTDTNGLLTDLEVNEDLVIERQTNTISDLFTGVTLTLFQQEAGTTIKIDIEQNLAAVKTEIEAFVEAYNAVRRFINTHSQIDTTTGAKSADAGVLFGSNVISSLQSTLTSLANGDVAGVSGDFSVLAQIGVTLVNNATVADALDKETLKIDDDTLDKALLSNPEDVRRLLAFDFSSSNPDVVLFDHTAETTHATAGYTLNINYDDRLQGDAIANNTDFTQVDAETGGPASNGISAIAFGDSIASGDAFRYSYDSATLKLTVVNLTTAASEVISVVAPIDAATGVGEDLEAGETANIVFPSLDLTVTLSGDDGFLRGTSFSDGTLDTSNLAPNLAMTTGAATTPPSGINKATLDALIAAGAYNQADGLLTLTLASTGAGEAHINTAAGIKFDIDGGPVLADISATDLDDGLPHSIGIYVNDGAADVKVATLSFDTLVGSALDAGQTITLDLGTGLFAETSVITGATEPMSNYLTFANGSFEVRDSNSTLLGTVNYLTTDSITDLATKISAISNVTATIVTSPTTFRLSVTHDTNDAITFSADTDALLTELNISDQGSTLFSANIGGTANGVDDGSATVSTISITATNTTGAEGLLVLFNGTADVSGVQIDFTVGIAARLFFELESFLDTTTGSIQAAIATLDGQTLLATDRIASIDRRLEIQRESLTARFIAAELALARSSSLLETITQTFELLAKNR